MIDEHELEAATLILNSHPGDQSAWKTVYAGLWHFVFVGALRARRDQESARDVAQETFVRLAFALGRSESRPVFRHAGALRLYLATIARNIQLDDARREVREQMAKDILELDSADRSSTAEDWLTSDVVEILDLAKRGLSSRDWSVFKMMSEGYTNPEIARTHNISDSAAVQVRVRVRKRFFKLLKDNGLRMIDR